MITASEFVQPPSAWALVESSPDSTEATFFVYDSHGRPFSLRVETTDVATDAYDGEEPEPTLRVADAQVDPDVIGGIIMADFGVVAPYLVAQDTGESE